MKKYLAGSFLIISFACFSQTPFFHYAYSMGYMNSDAASDHVLDPNNDIVIAANFNGSAVIDLDPTPGTSTVSGTTSYSRPALIKLSPNGQFIWGVKVASNGFDITASEVATDAAGNIYVAGGFNGTTDFNPGAGTFTVTSTAGSVRSLYLSKFNSSGIWQWTVPILGGGTDNAVGDVKVGPSGDIYICGDIEGGCDFDPSAATAALTPTGLRDGFIAKYNTNGQYQWAFLTGSNLYCSWTALSIDAAENIYCQGTFEGTFIDMDPGSGTSYINAPTNNHDIIIAKYNASKQYQWAFKLGTSTYETPGDLSCDANSVYVTASFTGSGLDIDPGAGTVLLNGTGGAGFVAKFSSAGSYMNAICLPGLKHTYPSLDPAGNIYITGSFTSTVDFDPGAGTTALTNSGGGQDIYAAKYNSSMTLQWAFNIGGSGNYDYSNSISIDPNQNVTICGFYNSPSIDFDPGASATTGNSAGLEDLFFARYSQTPDVGVTELNDDRDFILAPNPNNGIFSIQGSPEKSYDVTVYNTIGQVVKQVKGLKGTNEINIIENGRGFYNLVIRSGHHYKTVKIITE